jgi:glycosyltransferase involved in cell wall biosynthesis
VPGGRRSERATSGLSPRTRFCTVRILVCATEAPLPPLNGFRLQLRQLARTLADRHDVTVLAYRWPDQAGDPPAGVELVPLRARGGTPSARAAGAVRAALSRYPRATLSLTQPMSAAMADRMAGRSFDVVHVAGSALARLSGSLDGRPGVLAALDAWHLNIEARARLAPPPRRVLYRLEARKARRFEARWFRSFRSVITVSHEDARALRELDSRIATEVVPNGVDTEELAPNPRVVPEEDLVVFTGAMQWAPNAEAAVFLAHRVLPLLRAHRPGARLAVVGRRPAAAVQDLAGIPGVEVTGEVPDVRPWLWRARAYACPMMSGTGIKNKLLEALACGSACVATPLSCQGLRVVPGEDLLVAESPEDFAGELARVLEDDALRDRLAHRGRKSVVAGHDWESIGRAYESVYERALAQS